MKTVFSTNAQTLHVWAQQTQDRGRSSGGNVYFEGQSCYSYGSHYELGRIIRYKHMTLALINTKSYSQSTRQHISLAEDATRHLVTIGCPDGVMDVKHAMMENRKPLLEDMEKHFKKLKFFGWHTWDSSHLKEMITNHNTRCTLLDLPQQCKIVVTPEYIERYNAHIKKRLDRQKELDATADIRAAKRAAKAEEKAKADLDSWLAGGPLTQAVRKIPRAYIRIQGDKVMTTWGAEAPLLEAYVMLKRVKSGKAKPGDSVGYFRLTSYDGDVVKIGCHTLSLAQCEKALDS